MTACLQKIMQPLSLTLQKLFWQITFVGSPDRTVEGNGSFWIENRDERGDFFNCFEKRENDRGDYDEGRRNRTKL